MDILSKPLNVYSFEEVESFVTERVPEGDQIDYKREFPLQDFWRFEQEE